MLHGFCVELELTLLYDPIPWALCYGTMPLIQMQRDKKSSFNSYVQMYLKEEIKAEALVRNLPGFIRFLPVLALYHGQVLNVSATARDAGVSRTTVNEWFYRRSGG